MSESKTCNCTGIRSCLVCNKSVSSEESSSSLQSFWFCPSCSKLFKGLLLIPKDYVEEDWCALHQASIPSESCVKGIRIVQSFVSSEEESFLVKGIDLTEWKLSQSGRRKQVVIF